MRPKFAILIAIATCLVGVSHAGESGPPYEGGTTYEQCYANYYPVSESLECEVEALADTANGNLSAGFRAAGSTSGAEAGATLQRSFVEVAGDVNRFTVNLDLRIRGRIVVLSAVLRVENGEFIDGDGFGNAGENHADLDARPRTLVLEDHSPVAGRRVTLIVSVNAYYFTDYHYLPNLGNGICPPIYIPEGNSPCVPGVPLGPLPFWRPIGLSLESTPLASITATIRGMTLTTE